MRQRFHLDTPGWYHERETSEHLASVADAVWRQHVITVRYENWTRTVDHRLEPYGLVLKAGRWYLVARAGRGVGTFRVSQIRELTVLPDRFDWPEGFDLASYWSDHVLEFRSQLYRDEAVVRLSPSALDRLPHLLGRAVADAAAAGELQADGWVVARVPIESEDHAEREFLRLGDQVEVVEPGSLRERMATTARRLAALYAAP
jgi:predicted DNA-binding transcriptional regulator YafY